MQLLSTAPIVGVVLLVGGIVYVAVLVRGLALFARNITATPPNEALGDTVAEPLLDVMVSMMMLLSLGAVVVFVLLIAWLMLR